MEGRGMPLRVMRKSFHQSARLRRLADLILYVLIAIVVLGAFAFYGIYQARHGQHSDLPLKWIAFGVLTAIVFGYTIRDNRMSWKQSRFWAGLLSAFVAHLGLGFLLRYFDAVPLLLLASIAAGEFYVLNAWIISRRPNSSHNHHR